MEMKRSLPWVEKYRPRCLNELMSHEEIIKTIVRYMEAGQLPHLLLYGPPGTGKTSTITACAHAFYSKPGQYKTMVLEMNASDDRGINVVRDKIINFAKTGLLFQSTLLPKRSMHKLIILDEADAMTSEAQSALRRVIEQFTANVRFCFICNYLSPIIPAIQSRCTKFRFAPLPKDFMAARLEHIIKEENVYTESPKLLIDALCHVAEGDMRRAISVLQIISYCPPPADLQDEQVYECAGRPDQATMRSLIMILLNGRIDESIVKIAQIQNKFGCNLASIMGDAGKTIMRLNMPVDMKTEVIKRIADSEWRLASGASEQMEIGAFVAAFHIVRDMDPNHILY